MTSEKHVQEGWQSLEDQQMTSSSSQSIPSPFDSAIQDEEMEELSEATTTLPTSASIPPPRRRTFEVVADTGFVPAWEGLRGLAVVLTHCAHIVPGRHSTGILGVEIVFVLSGFLITGVLVSQIKKQDQAHEQSVGTRPRNFLKRFTYLPRFYMDRYVRLTPALTFMILGMNYMKATNTQESLAAFFYVRNALPKDPSDPRGGKIDGVLAHTWSLAVEEQFYIFWSLVISFILPLSFKGRAMVLVPLILGSFLLRVYSAGKWNAQTILFGIWLDYRWAYSTNAWKMFLGCSARLLPMPTVFTNKWVGMGALLSLGVDIYAQGWWLEEKGFVHFPNDGWWLEMLSGILVVLVVMGSIHGNPILESRFFRFMGRISYSWYLWQYPLQVLGGWRWGYWEETGRAFMIAVFTTFIIEEPLRNKYHAWKSKKPHTQVGK